MTSKVWTFDLEDGRHTVELEHNTASGDRMLRLDGQVLEQEKGLDQAAQAWLGSKHPFQINEHSGVAIIGTNGPAFEYSLELDGRPVPEGDSTVPAEPVVTPAEAIAEDPASTDSGAVMAQLIQLHAYVLKEIRSWGYWSLGLGALHLIGAGQLSASWGIILLLMGGASFLFYDAAMFVVYGTTLVWVALANLLSGTGGWMAFALLQVYLAFRTFRQFFLFRKAEGGYAALVAEGVIKDPLAGRAAKVFPWLGCLLGLISLGGLPAFFIGLILLGYDAIPDAAWLLLEVVFDVGVLGLAVSLASLLARYRLKFLAGLGVVTSGLVLLAYLVLYLLGRLH